MVEVGREQALDELRSDLRELADPRDRARQQQDREVRLVLAHLHAPQRLDLVASRRQSHRALTVHGAGAVDEPSREAECVFRLHSPSVGPWYLGSYAISKPSWQRVIPSTATSLESALRPTPVYFLGHALMMEYVTTGLSS